MSITTNAELLTALDGATGYLHRTDLTAKIPDFIRLCESKISRKLKLLLQELEDTTIVATIGSRNLAVPTRFGTPLKLWNTYWEPRGELRYLNDLPVTTTNASSDFYTVDGTDGTTRIKTENPADIAYTYTLKYLTKFDIATTSTNTVLTNYPDIYVYGACLESIPYTQDVTMFDLWNGLYAQAMTEAMRDTQATKGKATLRSELAAERSNIFRGY